MTAAATTDTRIAAATVGEPRELARYTISSGARIVVGQRVDGVVRFLPGRSVVLVVQPAAGENDASRPRRAASEAARSHAARPKRPNRTPRSPGFKAGGAS
jgi:hypothetical protein